MPPKRVKINPPSSSAQSKLGGTKLPAHDVNTTPLLAAGKTKTSVFPPLAGRHMGSLGLGEDLKGKGKAKENVDINNSSQDEDEAEFEDEDEDEDGMEWEDVFQIIKPAPETSVSSSKQMGDLVLTLENNKPEVLA